MTQIEATKFERGGDPFNPFLEYRHPKAKEGRAPNGNVHIFERMATRDRTTGMKDGAPIIVRGVSAQDAEKMLLERIESAKARYGEIGQDDNGEEICKKPAELVFAHIGMKDGWCVAESVYASKQKAMTLRAIVNADGSVEAY